MCHTRLRKSLNKVLQPLQNTTPEPTLTEVFVRQTAKVRVVAPFFFQPALMISSVRFEGTLCLFGLSNGINDGIPVSNMIAKVDAEVRFFSLFARNASEIVVEGEVVHFCCMHVPFCQVLWNVLIVRLFHA